MPKMDKVVKISGSKIRVNVSTKQRCSCGGKYYTHEGVRIKGDETYKIYVCQDCRSWKTVSIKEEPDDIREGDNGAGDSTDIEEVSETPEEVEGDSDEELQVEES